MKKSQTEKEEKNMSGGDKNWNAHEIVHAVDSSKWQG